MLTNITIQQEVIDTKKHGPSSIHLNKKMITTKIVSLFISKRKKDMIQKQDNIIKKETQVKKNMIQKKENIIKKETKVKKNIVNKKIKKNNKIEQDKINARRAYRRQLYQRNKKKNNGQHYKYDKVKAQQYYQATREKLKEKRSTYNSKRKRQKYLIKNKKYIKIKRNEFYLKNKTKILQKQKIYDNTHKPHKKEYYQAKVKKIQRYQKKYRKQIQAQKIKEFKKLSY